VSVRVFRWFVARCSTLCHRETPERPGPAVGAHRGSLDARWAVTSIQACWAWTSKVLHKTRREKRGNNVTFGGTTARRGRISLENPVSGCFGGVNAEGASPYRIAEMPAEQTLFLFDLVQRTADLLCDVDSCSLSWRWCGGIRRPTTRRRRRETSGGSGRRTGWARG